jgi:DNA-binding SARP family transcriptional activator
VVHVVTGTVMHDVSSAPASNLPGQRDAGEGAAAGAAAAPPRAAQAAWRLNVLGPVELCYGDQPVEVAGVTRTLLVLLARAAGEEVSTASIVAGIWGSVAPDDAENTVASHVSRLRKALTAAAADEDPTKVVVTMPAGYILDVAAPNVDVAAFERSVADAQRGLAVRQPDLAIARIDSGLKLWRGAAYEDVRDHALARAEAARLEELRLAALELRVAAVLAVSAPSAPESLVAELDALVAEHWHRERLWAALMTTLFRLGARSEALAAHRQAQVRLAQGLGAGPGAELQAVERAVLANDPTLLGTPLTATAVPAEVAVTVPACVGRREEADWLEAALDLAATRRSQARLIVGSAGIGKTRLVAEVAQRAAARGAVVRYGTGDADWSATLVAEPDRLNLVIIDNLDLATHEDLSIVVRFVRSAGHLPVLTLLTCRDSVRVGELAGLPKLVMSALDGAAIAEIVRIYAPAAGGAAAVAAMANAGGVPARLHRAASEWAFARAGRRIDRAVEHAAEPRRRLASIRSEIQAGVQELGYVRAQARRLRPARRAVDAPYKGLARYEMDDAEIFHGREALVAELVARIVEAPLVVVVGEPGAGKSSLVRAGLMPSLAAGVLPDSATWHQVTVTPASVGSLADRLAAERRAALVAARQSDPLPTYDTVAEDGSPAGTGGPEVSAQPSIADPGAAPRAGAELSDAPTTTSPDSATAVAEPSLAAPEMLLFVDQFEEVFTALDVKRREAFLAALEAAAATDHVVVTIRSDFYPRCAEHAGLARLVTANTMLVRSMSEEELRCAVERPAAAAGVSMTETLIDRVIADARAGDDGFRPGFLAHVSATLAAMWRARAMTVTGYEAVGGVANAIDSFAEAAFAALSEGAEREAARRIIVGLTGESGGFWVRRRVALASLLDQAGPGGSAALECLAGQGLILLHDDDVELVHDTILHGWSRLRAWQDDAVAAEQARGHLARAAAKWAAAGSGRSGLYDGVRLAAATDWAKANPGEVSDIEHDFLKASRQVVLAAEARGRRRVTLLWKWVFALVLALAAALAAGTIAVVELAEARAIAQQADAARLAAQARVEPDLRTGLLLAVAAYRLDSAVAPSLRDALARSPDLLATAGEGVTAIALSPDGGTIAVGSSDGSVSLVSAGALGAAVSAATRLEHAGRGPLGGLHFLPDGRRLVGWASGGSGRAGGIAVWDVATGALVAQPFGEVSSGATGALLADGATLVLAQGGPEPVTVAWSLDARTPSTAYDLPPTPARGLAASPDGSRLVWGTEWGAIIVDPSMGGARTLAGPAHPVALSPDGETLLTSEGGVLIAWDVGSGTRVGEARRHSGDVLAAAWSASGRAFASTDADGMIVVWDAQQLRPTHVLTGSRSPVRLARFSADGQALYTAGDDGALLAWDLTGKRGAGTKLDGAATPAALAGLACALAGRDMTRDEWARHLPDRPYRHVCPR